ncbi:hypothetical protein MKEN_01051600 [Mycena kentingensis (nom. inval.)]|nr:hypothetical protein MKEN_01051600 [Mycena kentingensis (nom. inval.)]
MFEEYCLNCGKQVDGRAYCNDSRAARSPPPYLQYAHGADVPPLVLAYDLYSASSSSASSTAWSMTDDESDLEQAPAHRAGLSYARRPSGINNGKALLHCRTGSGSMQSLCLPQSAPDDISSFEQRFATDDLDLDADTSHAAEDPSRPHSQTATITASKTRKKSNRASLPTYFSMLQISTGRLPSNVTRTSPTVASSATSTLQSRPSPPTPRLGLMAGLAAAQSEKLHHTPRGRRRPSRTRVRDVSLSHSRSPSPGRRRDSDEKVADWSSGLARGRAVRRNSSPPTKMAAAPAGSTTELSYHLRLSISPKLITERGRSDSRNLSGSRHRGRARADELDGHGQSPEHPGFGNGRSGLVGRARKGAVDEWFGIRGSG